MDLRARLAPAKEGYLLTGSAALPIHRLVVWTAKVEKGETKEIRWSSEENPDLLVRREREFEMRLPDVIVNRCGDCSLGVQAVSDVELGALTVTSEGVVLLSARTAAP